MTPLTDDERLALVRELYMQLWYVVQAHHVHRGMNILIRHVLLSNAQLRLSEISIRAEGAVLLAHLYRLFREEHKLWRVLERPEEEPKEKKK